MSRINLQTIIDFIPVPRKPVLGVKYIFTGILVFIFILLCIPSGSGESGYIARMKEFSPVVKAREIYDKEGPKAASEYVTFYQSLPNYRPDNALAAIKEEAEKQRSSWSYKAGEIGRGLIGMDQHEDYANITSTISQYVPYLSDARSIFAHGKGLYEHWNKFQNDESIDSLALGMDGIGLAASLWGLIPGVGHAADPVKSSTDTLRKCVGMMSSGVKNYVMQVFNKVFKFIGQSGILEIKASDFSQLSKLVDSKKEQFSEAMTLTGAALKELQPLTNLALDNWNAAAAVLANASTPEELNRYINIAARIDKSNEDIMQFGGSAALQAASRMDREGRFDVNLLKSAMLYGDAGLEAVGNIPAAEILAYPLRASSGFGFWRMALLAVFGLYVVLALIKIWRPEWLSEIAARTGKNRRA